MIIVFLVALLFFAMGFAIKYKKAYWLISGYNTMSEDKKKNVDVQGLGIFMGNMMFLMGGVLLVAALFLALKQAIIGIILLLLLIPLSLFIIIKAQAYDGNMKNEDGSLNRNAKLLIGVVAVSMVIIFIGVGFLLYAGNKSTEFIIEDHGLRTIGMYGDKVEFSSISNITLQDEIPKIEFKSNGSAIGSKMKGYFVVNELGKVKLFVDVEKPPFIYVETNSGLVILNRDNPEDTQDLYGELYNAWQTERDQ